MFLPWHVSLFHGLSDEERRVIEALPWRQRHFEKKEIVLHAGREYRSLWILTQGECQALLPTRGEDQPLVVEVLVAPVVLAAGILFASEAILPVDVLAITDGMMIGLERESLADCLGKCGQLRRNFLQDVSDKIALLSRRLFLLQLSLEQRVLWYLSEVAGDKREIKLPMTIDRLSQYLFVTRPALSRTLALLEEKGYFSRKRHVFILHDRFFGLRSG